MYDYGIMADMGKVWKILFGGQENKAHNSSDSRSTAHIAFENLSEQDKARALKEGAGRFTRDFKDTIVTLANE